MIALFGQLSLDIALFFALLQSLLPLFGYRHTYTLAMARPAALGQFTAVIIAYALLTMAFVSNDFSIAYVAANSHSSLPLFYRITAVWGAHEGSILFWIVILNAWTVLFSVTQKNVASRALVLAILGVISILFLCFLIFTSNPFLSASLDQTAQDLNPLLQDPGFIIHPPMLYMGYVGFSVAFAITQAALWRGQLDAAWVKITRQFAIAAWCFLTLGITLGSWWAYRVLGWGGFWFWDPVENASLLPWLSGTALIHVLLLVEKRDAAKIWAVLLTITSFALSLLGTFLVRSGILISAHTFANDPARGVFLLLIFAIVIIVTLIIDMIRMPRCTATAMPPFAWSSRESALLLNSALLFIAMLTILLGTLYPLILDALHLGAISVGAPYFNQVMLPLVLFLMFVMGFGPFCQWHVTPHLWRYRWKKLLTAFLSATLLLVFARGHINLIAVLSLSLSFWIILSVIDSIRTRPSMSLAHLGFAMLIIGVMLSSLLSEERNVRMIPGDHVSVGPYQFYFLDTEGIRASNYRGIRATIDVMKNTHHVTTLHPEKRIYTVRDTVMTIVDIHPGIFRDLYVALGEPLEGTAWSMRIYYKPFIRWIWGGGLLMMLGGVIALWRLHKKSNS